MSGLPVSFVLLGIAAVAFAVHRYTKRRHYKLPPGPKGIPFFGNTFQVPKSNEWVQYAKWGKEYSMWSAYPLVVPYIDVPQTRTCST